MGKSAVGRGALIIAVSVLISRVLGVLREVMLAGFAGIGVQKNAYDLAFLIPDIVNHLISTGYLSITFIPLFTGWLVLENKERAWDLFSNVLNCFMIVLLPMVIGAWIWAEPLIRAVTNPDPDPQTLAMAVYFCRIILPAQIFFFIGTLLVAVQQVHLRFFVPAMTGLVYNSSIILGGWLGRSSGLGGFAWGVLGGAVIGSFFLQLIGSSGTGIKYRFKADFLDKDFIRYVKLTLPLVLGLGAVFALEFIFRRYGSRFGSGGIAKLGYAYRMMYTLVAVFGFSVGAASYPLLARMAKEKAFNRMNALLFGSIGKLFSILAPVILVFWYCSGPAVRIMLERGQFTPDATVAVGQLLKVYLWGAFALSAQVILLRCFYALERMWIPTLINTGIFALSLPMYEYAAIAAGISAIPLIGVLSACVQVGVLLWLWISIAGSDELKGPMSDIVKTGLISGAMFFLLLAFKESIWNWRLENIWMCTALVTLFGSGVFALNFSLQVLWRVDSARELLKGAAGRFWK